MKMELPKCSELNAMLRICSRGEQLSILNKLEKVGGKGTVKEVLDFLRVKTRIIERKAKEKG